MCSVGGAVRGPGPLLSHNQRELLRSGRSPLNPRAFREWLVGGLRIGVAGLLERPRFIPTGGLMEGSPITRSRGTFERTGKPDPVRGRRSALQERGHHEGQSRQRWWSPPDGSEARAAYPPSPTLKSAPTRAKGKCWLYSLLRGPASLLTHCWSLRASPQHAEGRGLVVSP